MLVLDHIAFIVEELDHVIKEFGCEKKSEEIGLVRDAHSQRGWADT